MRPVFTFKFCLTYEKQFANAAHLPREWGGLGPESQLDRLGGNPAGRPVIGATVIEKGTNNGTATGGDGRFTLRTRTAAPRLVISSLGYVTQEVASTEAASIKLAESSTSLDAVQVVGSRSQNRSVTDSPSPVDIIDIREVTVKTGQLDVNQLLQFVVSSFNSNRQTGADGADHVDLGSVDS